MMTKKARDLALGYFAQKFNCAEAVLMGVTQSCGIEAGCAPRIATGFGAGFGGCGEVCGALSGAVMALGLKLGRESGDDVETKNALSAKVVSLFEAFESEFTSVRCIDLTECDMRTPEGMERAKALGLHTDFCPKFVAFAAEKAAEMMSA